MATTFPATSLDAYVTIVDNVDMILAEHINDPRDAIVAIETKLGVDSSLDPTSIDYFLNNASGEYRNHIHDGTSNDGAKLDWDTCRSDMVHSHANDTEGGLLDWDTCWTDAVHSHLSNANGGTLGVGGFGTWVDYSSSYTNQQVATDGFLVAWTTNVNGNCYLSVLTDSSATPSTLRAFVGDQNSQPQTTFIFAALKKNEYFRIYESNCVVSKAYFMPVGS